MTDCFDFFFFFFFFKSRLELELIPEFDTNQYLPNESVTNNGYVENDAVKPVIPSVGRRVPLNTRFWYGLLKQEVWCI